MEACLIKGMVLSQVPQRTKARALLRRCATIAWHCNDTGLMAWVMGQAAVHGLPLSDFAPSVPAPLEHGAHAPPPYIREVLARDSLAVAFVSLGGEAFWTANDAWDRQVCSRAALHDARGKSTCEVSALFSPADQVCACEREVLSQGR